MGTSAIVLAVVVGWLALSFALGRAILRRTAGRRSYARVALDSALALLVFTPLAAALHDPAYVFACVGLIAATAIIECPFPRR